MLRALDVASQHSLADVLESFARRLQPVRRLGVLDLAILPWDTRQHVHIIRYGVAYDDASTIENASHVSCDLVDVLCSILWANVLPRAPEIQTLRRWPVRLIMVGVAILDHFKALVDNSRFS